MMRSCVILILLLCASCSNDLPDKEKLVSQFYQQKIQEFKDEKMSMCREDIRAEVQIHIDSIIDTWINAELVDTIQFPNKPIKPIRPEVIIDKFQKFSLDSLNN